jgi:hypothetical protein
MATPTRAAFAGQLDFESFFRVILGKANQLEGGRPRPPTMAPLSPPGVAG